MATGFPTTIIIFFSQLWPFKTFWLFVILHSSFLLFSPPLPSFPPPLIIRCYVHPVVLWYISEINYFWKGSKVLRKQDTVPPSLILEMWFFPGHRVLKGHFPPFSFRMLWMLLLFLQSCDISLERGVTVFHHNPVFTTPFFSGWFLELILVFNNCGVVCWEQVLKWQLFQGIFSSCLDLWPYYRFNWFVEGSWIHYSFTFLCSSEYILSHMWLSHGPLKLCSLSVWIFLVIILNSSSEDVLKFISL